MVLLWPLSASIKLSQAIGDRYKEDDKAATYSQLVRPKLFEDTDSAVNSLSKSLPLTLK